MYITFNNKFENNSIVVFYNNQNYTIAPLSSVEVPLFGNKVQFTAENGGKPWRYILLPHDVVDRTASFEYLIATH